MLFIFTPKIGEDFFNLTYIFQMGWFNHQLEHFEYREFSGSFIPMITMP